VRKRNSCWPYAALGISLLVLNVPTLFGRSPQRLLAKQFVRELERLASNQSPRRFRVIIRLEEQHGTGSFDDIELARETTYQPAPIGATATATANDEMSRRPTGARLRAHSTRASAKLLEHVCFLETSDASTDAQSIAALSIKHLWIVNALAASLTADELLEIAQRKDVVHISRVFSFPALARPPVRALAASSGVEPDGDANKAILAQLKVTAARESLALDGAGVRIGHIDTGADASHPELQGKIAAFRDFIHQRPTPYDDDGHGTHTAGLIASSTRGIAPKSQLFVAKALDSKGDGSLETLLSAMQWMLDPDGDPETDDQVHIINNSWGIDRILLRSAGIDERYFWDAVQAWRRAGILVVFSIGNSGPGSQSVPGCYPMVLAVGSVDDELHVAPFSASGIAVWGDKKYMRPDLVAPGVEIASCKPGGGTLTLTGTSQSAPLITGVLALMRQAAPRLARSSMERVLLTTCRDLGEPGRDVHYGQGIVDALRAVEGARALDERTPHQ